MNSWAKAKDVCPISVPGLLLTTQRDSCLMLPVVEGAAVNRPRRHAGTAFLLQLRVITQALQGFANPTYLSRFLCSGLLRVAPYCVAGGIRVVSTISRIRSLTRMRFTHLSAAPSP